MSKLDSSFLPDTGLEYAIDLLRKVPLELDDLPESFPAFGVGEIKTLEGVIIVKLKNNNVRE